jgi:hypothetical protein
MGKKVIWVKTIDSLEQPRGLDRRGFLRRAVTMAAGGLGAAALLDRPDGSSASANPMEVTPAAPVPAPAGVRPGEPYFFRIETTGAGRPATAPAVKEV